MIGIAAADGDENVSGDRLTFDFQDEGAIGIEFEYRKAVIDKR